MGCAGRARVRQLRCASSGTAIPYGDRNRVVTCLHGSIEPSRLMLRRLGKRAVAAVSRPAAGSGVGAQSHPKHPRAPRDDLACCGGWEPGTRSESIEWHILPYHKRPTLPL